MKKIEAIYVSLCKISDDVKAGKFSIGKVGGGGLL